VTDPVVDTIFLVISYLIVPSAAHLLDGFFTATIWAFTAVFPGNTLEKSARFVHIVVGLLLLLLRH
jgi:small-conductance mechanosensitive channel